MTSRQQSKCADLISQYKLKAGVHGSNLGLSKIMTNLVVEIGYVFGYDVSGGLPSDLQIIVTSYSLGSGANKLLTGWIPVVGKAVSHVSAAGCIEEVGNEAIKFFDAL